MENEERYGFCYWCMEEVTFIWDDNEQEYLCEWCGEEWDEDDQ